MTSKADEQTSKAAAGSRKILENIRDATGASEDDIRTMLLECSGDVNLATEKLLECPFSKVVSKKEKRKEKEAEKISKDNYRAPDRRNQNYGYNRGRGRADGRTSRNYSGRGSGRNDSYAYQQATTVGPSSTSQANYQPESFQNEMVNDDNWGEPNYNQASGDNWGSEPAATSAPSPSVPPKSAYATVGLTFAEKLRSGTQPQQQQPINAQKAPPKSPNSIPNVGHLSSPASYPAASDSIADFARDDAVEDKVAAAPTSASGWGAQNEAAENAYTYEDVSGADITAHDAYNHEVGNENLEVEELQLNFGTFDLSASTFGSDFGSSFTPTTEPAHLPPESSLSMPTSQAQASIASLSSSAPGPNPISALKGSADAYQPQYGSTPNYSLQHTTAPSTTTDAFTSQPAISAPVQTAALPPRPALYAPQSQQYSMQNMQQSQPGQVYGNAYRMDNYSAGPQSNGESQQVSQAPQQQPQPAYHSSAVESSIASGYAQDALKQQSAFPPTATAPPSYAAPPQFPVTSANAPSSGYVPSPPPVAPPAKYGPSQTHANFPTQAHEPPVQPSSLTAPQAQGQLGNLPQAPLYNPQSSGMPPAMGPYGAGLYGQYPQFYPSAANVPQIYSQAGAANLYSAQGMYSNPNLYGVGGPYNAPASGTYPPNASGTGGAAYNLSHSSAPPSRGGYSHPYGSQPPAPPAPSSLGGGVGSSNYMGGMIPNSGYSNTGVPSVGYEEVGTSGGGAPVNLGGYNTSNAGKDKDALGGGQNYGMSQQSGGGYFASGYGGRGGYGGYGVMPGAGYPQAGGYGAMPQYGYSQQQYGKPYAGGHVNGGQSGSFKQT